MTRRRGVAAAIATAAVLLLGACEIEPSGVDPEVREVVTDAGDARAPAATAADTRGTTTAPSPGSPSTVRPTSTTRPVAPSGGNAAGTAATVTRIVDGDTLVVVVGGGATETVRVAGIDTPERGDCGYGEATRHLSSLTLGRNVVLTRADSDDRDRYGRLIRYIDVDGVDAGLAQITGGFAIARYDSRDGYGWHPREDDYIAADNATAHMCPGFGSTSGRGVTGTTATSSTNAAGEVYYANCAAARAAGAAPIRQGQPGYRTALDGDRDGVACE
ncbi:MAG: thermonuclease family protein [Actinobacteria bacterium]|nr:thermonuclease family protein [Actinomycetota bacterium]